MLDNNLLRRLLLGLALPGLALVACAPEVGDEGDELTTPDAGPPVRLDAGAQPTPPQPQPPGATQVDAGVPVPPPDACVPNVTQLLLNPSFDMAPQGAAWKQTGAMQGYPLITTQDGVPEHSPSLKAWLGGFEAPTGTVTDSLSQNVAIPAGTTHLVLTGFLDVRTGETTNAVYDTAEIVIEELDGTPIATVASLSNLTAKTKWTAFGYVIMPNLSGRTVRVKLTSSNDVLDATSFYFDSLALTATHGCGAIN